MTAQNTTFDIVVIGAGLSGLAAALLAHEKGLSVCVLESRDQSGGRIRSVTNDDGEFRADLGPTWIWPMAQPVISRWIEKLGLTTFPQYDDGNTILDLGPDEPPRVGFIPGQDGSMRIAGGSQALIAALIARLPRGCITANERAKSVRTDVDAIAVRSSSGVDYSARHLIVALPPRIAAGTLEWLPALPDELSVVLNSTPTWMAPHAKVAILYETPFWRDEGLSGRIVSRAGPIVECHDHCASDGSEAALWGFIGWPHEMRAELGNTLTSHIHTQLKRCFGADRPDPLSIHIKDWSTDTHVASRNDLEEPMDHPSVRPDILRKTHFGGCITFAGSETADRSPGLIEGAFVAAERAVLNVSALHTTSSEKVVG